MLLMIALSMLNRVYSTDLRHNPNRMSVLLRLGSPQLKVEGSVTRKPPRRQHDVRPRLGGESSQHCFISMTPREQCIVVGCEEGSQPWMKGCSTASVYWILFQAHSVLSTHWEVKLK